MVSYNHRMRALNHTSKENTMKLHIDEAVLRYRKAKNMTQEELASALGVSPQSVSNWEHGGYPDIELLPVIANYFGITVDELIGSDKASVEADMKRYYEGLNENGRANLEHCLAYHRKYPNNYAIMNDLCIMIMNTRSHIKPEYMEMLRRLCERIIAECTESHIRESAIWHMCDAAEGEEFEKWAKMLPVNYCNTYYERLERYAKRMGDREREQNLNGRNNLSVILHLLYRYQILPHLDDPAECEHLSRFRMSLLEYFGGGKVPDGWLAWHADFRMHLALALFVENRMDEGWQELREAVSEAVRYIGLPAEVPLDLGTPILFRNIRTLCNKNEELREDVYIYPDGTHLDHTLSSFGVHHRRSDFIRTMEIAPGFAFVRDTAEFAALLEKLRQA